MIRHGMRYLTGFILLVCLLAMLGCNKHNSNGSDGDMFYNHSNLQSGETELQKLTYEGPLSCVTHHSGWGRMSLMDMTEEFHEKVLDLLNGGTWMNDVTKCESDYEFETKNEEIRYHSECGTFIDVTNQRSLQLSDEEQAEINRMLGVK